MRYLLLTTLIIIFAGALVWFGKVAYQKPPSVTGTPYQSSLNSDATGQAVIEPMVTFIDPVRGDKNAPVTIVEFGDYRCVFCLQQEPILQAVLAAYPNDVRLVWKDFPNDYLHVEASASAAAARCAGEQGNYWGYHDALMSRAMESNLISYADIAATLSLDRADFQTCIDSRRMSPQVQKSLEEALSLRLAGAPSFFINGRPFDGVSFEEFKAAIDGFLKK